MIIVVYLVASWETFHRRPMLEALAIQALGQATILCVNPTIFLRQAISPRGSHSKVGLLSFGGAKRLTENLYVGTPVILVPGGGRRWHQKGSIGWEIVSRQIRNAVHKIDNGINKVISWVYRPEQKHCLELIGKGSVIYECYDEYSLCPFDSLPVPGMEDREKKLLSEVDLVFTTSMTLFESKSKKHPVIKYAPNGVDFDLFNRAVKDDLLIPEDIVRISPPRIGYVGNICGRINFDILEDVINARDDCSFVFLGSIKEDVYKAVKSLSRHPNVHFLGVKPYLNLPNYLKAFNACIIPYKIHDSYNNSNPLKLWQYLAAGKPVIATETKEMYKLIDVIWIANDAGSFISAIENGLNNLDEYRIESGIKIAMQLSWDKLTNLMLSDMKGLLFQR